MANWQYFVNGDTYSVLQEFPDGSIDCIITSPPYWQLRDYGFEGQIGLEPSLEEYLERMLRVTAELHRVLRKTGVMFWNHGDCYGGSNTRRDLEAGTLGSRTKRTPVFQRTAKMRPKSLAFQNYRLVLRMLDEQGWILRNAVIWHKPNAMPSSVRDRFSNQYEPVFLLVKSRRYWFDLDAVRVPHMEPERNGREEKIGQVVDRNGLETGFAKKRGGWADYWRGKREYNPLGKNPGDVWRINSEPYSEAHYATFPRALVRRCIEAACPREVCPKCGKARTRTDDKLASGWTDCGCDAGWRPGIILDPFVGSGTTLQIAAGLGRPGIGIDANPENMKLAQQRVGALLFRPISPAAAVAAIASLVEGTA